MLHRLTCRPPARHPTSSSATGPIGARRTVASSPTSPAASGAAGRGQGARLLGAGLAPLPARPRRAREHRLPRPPRASPCYPGRVDRARSCSGTARTTIFFDGARRRPAAGRAVVARDELRDRRDRPAHPRRRRLARPRRVPPPALRRPRVAPGGADLDLRRDDDRRHARRGRRLLPRLGRHDRLAADRDHDGVPGAALHHRARAHRRQPAQQRSRSAACSARASSRSCSSSRSSAGSTRRGSSARRCSRSARRSSSRRR